MRLKALIEKTYMLRRSYVSEDIVRTLDILSNHIKVKYKDHKFESGMEHNGWVVPKKWEVMEAKIYKSKKLIYDGMKHPLGVIANSSSFEGEVDLAELKKHLFSAPRRPKTIPFHFRLQYRPWEEEWGFCVPDNLKKSLKQGKYRVVLKTKLSKGEMVVREFVILGKRKESIVLAAHVDHPGLANDDLSGCVVGIEVISRILKQYKKTRYTYRLVLGPEITGAVFYLHSLKEKVKKLKYGLYLEMLGNKKRLKLQRSFAGDTYIDMAAELVLRAYSDSEVCGFRESAGNDEIVFEAPGYEIPMPSISRWPYAEYHTSDDNLSIIGEKQLQEAVGYVMGVVEILETDVVPKRKFSGLPSLANPKYDLYVDPGEIITGGLHQQQVLSLFQYKMPRMLEGDKSVLELAHEHGVDYWWLVEYLNNYYRY